MELAAHDTLSAPSKRRVARPSRAEGGVARRADLFELYVGMLDDCTPLPAEEQTELARRHQRGDATAGGRLVRSNLRLVVRMARQMPRGRAELADLVQAGNVGLLEALERFDPERGVRFTTYAQFWIRAAMLEHLLQAVPSLNIGSTRAGRRLFFNLHKARHRLEANGEVATVERLAERFEVPVEEVVALARLVSQPALSTSDPLFASDPEGPTLGETLSTDSEQGELGAERSPMLDPERAMAQAELAHLVRRAVSDFGEQLGDERARAIWLQRMVAEQPETLAQLAERFGVSKERVRQLEQRLAQTFKRFLELRLGPTTLEPELLLMAS